MQTFVQGAGQMGPVGIHAPDPAWEAATRLGQAIAETFARHGELSMRHKNLDKDLALVESELADCRERLMKLMAEVTDALHRPLRAEPVEECDRMGDIEPSRRRRPGQGGYG